ncbi:MAG TPA: hypothetical protein VML55_24430 [Planctomycetaceae bacterium]|nr:hypothetical protein [Planctomycetaceae bacterium]
MNDGTIVRPYVSLFNSTHAASGNAMADMSDVMLGAVAVVGDFTLDARYAWYTMNPLMRSDVHELGAKASFDVLAWGREPDPLRPLSLRPFAGLYGELSDQNGTEDVFLNVGLEPSWRFEIAGRQLGVTLPVDWGLSADRYYLDADGSNAMFGYFSAACTTSVSLPARDSCGRWFLNTSLQYVHLAADSVRAVSGRDHVWIGRIGVSFVF